MALVLSRTLLTLRRAIQFRLVPAVAYELGRLRSPRQAVYRWPEGEMPLGPRVCVFVHWDGAGEVREHVLHYVLSLADAGLSVLFVTINLVVDLLYYAVDPRLRVGRAA